MSKETFASYIRGNGFRELSNDEFNELLPENSKIYNLLLEESPAHPDLLISMKEGVIHDNNNRMGIIVTGGNSSLYLNMLWGEPGVMAIYNEECIWMYTANGNLVKFRIKPWNR